MHETPAATPTGIEPSPATEPTAITVDRPSMTLRLEFADGGAGEIGLMELRLHCPCATCRGRRGAGEAAWPQGGAPTPLAAESAELVGAWGLRITWNDRHATGIYPFAALRKWIDAGHPVLTPDSGLPT